MTLTRRALLAGAGSLALAGPLGAAGAGVRVLEGPAFGASWRAIVPAGVDVEALGVALQAELAAVDAAMSPFRTDSEITRFNASDTTGWFALSPPTFAVVAAALEVADATAGAFDPTVGGIVGQFGFGPIHRRSRGNHTGVSIRAGAVRKAMPDLTLDLCGIAKGYAVDRMGAVIRSFGAADFLVEVGGEVSAVGRHPAGRPWQVAIERPERGVPGVQHVVALSGEALATSGDRVNSYVSGGRRYSHLIDPRRRTSADPALASVSVLAPSGMRADAMATALSAMGHEAGPDFAARHGLPALFLVRGRNGIREVTVAGFADRVFG